MTATSCRVGLLGVVQATQRHETNGGWFERDIRDKGTDLGMCGIRVWRMCHSKPWRVRAALPRGRQAAGRQAQTSMRACVCACIHAFMPRMHTNTNTHTHACVRTCKHTHTRTHIHTHTHACVYKKPGQCLSAAALRRRPSATYPT